MSMKYCEKFPSRINPNLNDFLQEFFHASRIREVSAAALWLFQLCPKPLGRKILVYKVYPNIPKHRSPQAQLQICCK